MTADVLNYIAICILYNVCKFAVICSFKKIFDFSCTDIAVECMKMFDYCEVSDVNVIAKSKLKFYARSHSIVCLACNEYLVRDLSLSGHVCGSFSV